MKKAGEEAWGLDGLQASCFGVALASFGIRLAGSGITFNGVFGQLGPVLIQPGRAAGRAVVLWLAVSS
ncbi:hypothetical protein [Paenibacillus puerhi]|uniref:hypothetical protein n=1 Tax=Paenibacillus puerhi TaxID=2692622 RepID=UPI00191693C3|nr:hypothetical protein [Paenibacillus puerhi]